MKRLRIAHIVVQPVVVWDDGEEITPGPELAAQRVTLRQAVEMAEKLPQELVALEAALAERETTQPPPE